MFLLIRFLVLGVVFFLPGVVFCFPVNEKKAPESREDLMLIQDALQAALPRAKAATVCVDLGEGFGSGVIVSEDGLVMTAAHVSTGVGKDLTIILPDGRRLEAMSLGLMADVDAAFIQITEVLPEGEVLPTVELNRADDMKLGDWIFSLGHSGGFDKARGAVARIGRLVRVANSTFQTDGTLIGGDSGGPLFDMDGRLVGIHSRVGLQLPVNLHVPTRLFIENWDRLLASEFIGEGPFAKKPVKGRGYLGVATKGAEGGIVVTKVGKGSPAAEAGILVGDVLVSVNEVGLESREGLQEILAEMAVGDKLVFKIKRDGKDENVELQLGLR